MPIEGCILCGPGGTLKPLRISGDTLVYCEGCYQIFRSPRPSPEELQKFYEQDYHRMIDEKTIAHHRLNHFRSLLKRLSSLPRGRLLDIGCGYGHFLEMAKQDGWNVIGTEVNPELCGYVREKIGVEIFYGELKAASFPSEHFDLVTLWNVLAHIYDPFHELCEIHRILKPGGILFLRAANFTFNRAGVPILKVVDQWLKPKRPLMKRLSVFHNHCYTPSSLRSLLQRAGFIDIKIKNSHPTSGDPYAIFPSLGHFWVDVLKRTCFLPSEFLYYLSAGHLVFSPNMEILAIKEKE